MTWFKNHKLKIQNGVLEKFAKSKRDDFDVIFAIFNGRFEHEGNLTTRRKSEEIFAMTRAFFRGVKLENRPSISDFRKMANFM